MKSQAIIGLNKAMKNPQGRPAGKRVFVGLSGGVDSSVSAALLKQAGYDVTGVFIKVWQPDWLECTWKQERHDAMRVAAHLDIPFVTLNLEDTYKREVVDYMIAEYRAGRTPNPDVMCNKTVKFGGFYEWAMNEGADFVATGHYSQVQKSKIKINSQNPSPFVLRTSQDTNKDQSYFLWNIRTEQLEHILFPIGHLTKPQVRKLADTFQLPTALKKDSQGICFIGMVDMKTFLSYYIESKPGNVLDQSGKVIGVHSGAVLYTIGERRGFTITTKGSHDGAYYVVGKDIIQNTITVREKAHTDTTSPEHTHSSTTTDAHSPHQINISHTNWISGAPIPGKIYHSRSRYRQVLEKCTCISIDTVDASAVMEYSSPQETTTPGQSLVIYEGDVCLGGGIIRES